MPAAAAVCDLHQLPHHRQRRLLGLLVHQCQDRLQSGLQRRLLLPHRLIQQLPLPLGPLPVLRLPELVCIALLSHGPRDSLLPDVGQPQTLLRAA
ncbi:MAG: hypothetical protein ACK559_18385 [bacterium]